MLLCIVYFLILYHYSLKMADSMQPKRLNINNNIDQSITVLDSNERVS